MPLPDRPQHAVGGDGAVLEIKRAGRAAADAQLVLLGADSQAGRAALDQEGGELLAVDLGEDGEQIGEAGVGDELLGAVQLPALAVGGQHGLGLGGQSVRSRSRFGQGVGGDALSGGQAGQVALALLGRAEQHQRHGADAHVRAVADGERTQAADRLGDQAAAGLVAAQAAVRLGDVVAQQAHLAGLLQQGAHDARFLGLDLRGARLDLAAHEILGGVAHHALLVAEHLGRQDGGRPGGLKEEAAAQGQRDVVRQITHENRIPASRTGERTC